MSGRAVHAAIQEHPDGIRPATAAWVDGEPVVAAVVHSELARLRSGPRAALLPGADSPEGRQLRRWVTQTVVVRRLLERELTERGLAVDSAPAVQVVLPSATAGLTFGGVLASVLRQSAPARAVFVAVTAPGRVTTDEVAAYVRRTSTPGRAADPAHAQRVLLDGRRREVFLDWLAAQLAARVRLEAGFEHPGDPHQPDATHRH
jgi:[acyl-carrier-protein] S-malonyltransferase